MDPYLYKYYLDYNYFSKINEKLRNIKLNEIQEQYLYLFALYSHTSPYDIATGKKIDDSSRENIKINSNIYTQAKIIVRQLSKLKLIDRDKEREKNSHNKKFYSLTDIGLFYIISSPTFLSIDIQAIIRNYPNFKLFQDLLYPFIKLDTLCSAVNIPIDILHAISLYIQKYYLKIKNFICHTKNKNDWNENPWTWNIEKLRKYLIGKYKYEWLENAETKENYEHTILKFFNENKRKRSEYIDVRLGERNTWGSLIIGPKKKKQHIIANLETFLIKLHFSKEENIGRSFSTIRKISPSEFVFLLLSDSRSFNFDTLLLLSKDENFIKSLETAKEDFNKIYRLIKNPYQYPTEARLAKNFWEISLAREIKLIHDKSTS